MAVEFRSFGPVAEQQLQQAEQRLGFRLPEEYRRWLAATNGGDSVRSVRLPDVNFLWEHRAFGLRPDSQLDDIVYLYTYFQDRFTPDYLPVAPLSGGLLAVKVRGEETGSVWFWDDDDPRPLDADMSEEEDLTPEQIERRLIFCGNDWDEFLANLTDQPTYSDEELDERLRNLGLLE